MDCWTNDKIIQFIELYREKECIWNPRSTDHKCRNTMHDAWTDISLNLDISVVELKRKIKNLVCQFNREHKKYYEAKKSGSGAQRLSKWFAYKYLLFLKDKNKVRHCTEGGIQNADNSSDSLDFSLEEENNDRNLENEMSEETVEQISQSNIAIETNSQDVKEQLMGEKPQCNKTVSLISSIDAPVTQPADSITKQKVKIFQSPKKVTTQKKKKNTNEEKQEEAYLIMKEMYNNKKSRTKSVIFGEFVASKMESLSTDHARNTVEHLISNILWEASLGKYDQPSQPLHKMYSPYPSRPTPSPSSMSLASYSSSPSHINSSYYHLTSETLFSNDQHPGQQLDNNWSEETESTLTNVNTLNGEETSNIILNAFQNS